MAMMEVRRMSVTMRETVREHARARVYYVVSELGGGNSGWARRGGDGAEVGQIRLQLFHSALSQSLSLALSASSKHEESNVEDVTKMVTMKKNFNF